MPRHVCQGTYAKAPMPRHLCQGTYAKARHGSNLVNILNIVSDGEIIVCAANGDRSRVVALKPTPVSSIVELFALINIPSYLLDLRQAPPELSAWLKQSKDHWNGFVSWGFPTSEAFDIAYYSSPVSSDCVLL